jgi:hypothetical protein
VPFDKKHGFVKTSKTPTLGIGEEKELLNGLPYLRYKKEFVEGKLRL